MELQLGLLEKKVLVEVNGNVTGAQRKGRFQSREYDGNTTAWVFVFLYAYYMLGVTYLGFPFLRLLIPSLAELTASTIRGSFSRVLETRARLFGVYTSR